MTLVHLIGHDGETTGDDALALARTLGAGRDVRRVVVHVLALGGPTSVAMEPWVAAQPESVREDLARVRGHLDGDEVFEVLAADSVARGLHDWAEVLGADLVVLGSRPQRLRERPLGTIADRLLSGGPCAVAHAPARYAAASRTPARIVVGFDGSSEARNALAEAEALAVTSGALVDVLYAHDASARTYGLPGAVLVTPEELHEAQHAAAALADEALRSLPESVRGTAVGRPGAAGPALELFAREQGADLVVVGSRGYGPVRRALLGSTGSHLIARATCSVLVVPRGAHVTVPAEVDELAVAP